jgi:hypothetical protein
MESVNDVLRKQEAASAVDELIAWAERHLEAEEGPGDTDRPEYIELRAILAKLPK